MVIFPITSIILSILLKSIVIAAAFQLPSLKLSCPRAGSDHFFIDGAPIKLEKRVVQCKGPKIAKPNLSKIKADHGRHF